MANAQLPQNVKNFGNFISSSNIQNLISMTIKEPAERKQFTGSLLDLYEDGGDYLQKCDSMAIVKECLKAAQLHLPLIKSLGYAYIVPYKNIPTFIVGWKGLVQLAQNTGKYRYINADAVYEGEQVVFDRLSGSVKITGEPTSDKAIGYFAYIELLNGFEKTVYMTKEQMEAYGKKYSKAYDKGPWQTDFDAMARKTVLRKVLKYGPASTQMMQVEDAEIKAAKNAAEAEVKANANSGPVVDVAAKEVTSEAVEPATEEMQPDF